MNSSKNISDDDKYFDEWRTILALTYIGFSLSEIRYMPMKDCICFIDLYHQANNIENDPDLKPGERWATQSDIDNFF